jgi:hypothetical protein
VIAALPTAVPATLPKAVAQVLKPPRPALVPLPAMAELDLDGLDRIARSTISEWFEDRMVLRAYFDPLQYARQTDNWASRDDWLAAARRFHTEKFRDPQIEFIRLDLGETTDKAAWLDCLRQYGWHGENSDSEIAAVYRFRYEIPEVAREWLSPRPFEDCPGAECRAREGDWIASRFIAATFNAEGLEPWRGLGHLTPSAVDVFCGKDRVQEWREKAVRAIDETWDWRFADEALLNSAIVQGWSAVGEAMARNEYLVHALLQDDHSMMFAGRLIVLAWSRLAPSDRLARLIGALLGQDLRRRAEGPARRLVGAKTEEFEKMIPGIADHWTVELRRALAVAWTRCRRLVR